MKHRQNATTWRVEERNCFCTDLTSHDLSHSADNEVKACLPPGKPERTNSLVPCRSMIATSLSGTQCVHHLPWCHACQCREEHVAASKKPRVAISVSHDGPHVWPTGQTLTSLAHKRRTVISGLHLPNITESSVTEKFKQTPLLKLPETVGVV